MFIWEWYNITVEVLRTSGIGQMNRGFKLHVEHLWYEFRKSDMLQSQDFPSAEMLSHMENFAPRFMWWFSIKTQIIRTLCILQPSNSVYKVYTKQMNLF